VGFLFDEAESVKPPLGSTEAQPNLGLAEKQTHSLRSFLAPVQILSSPQDPSVAAKADTVVEAPPGVAIRWRVFLFLGF
jgi:hypothetical protein